MRWLAACLFVSCGAAGPLPSTTDPLEQAQTKSDTSDAWTNPCSTLFCSRPPGMPPAKVPGEYRGSFCGCVEQRGCVAETVKSKPELAPFAEMLGCGAWPQFPSIFEDQLP